MPDCPFNSSVSPCDLELDLMILCEAERESMKIFYKHTQLLDTVLTANGIPIPVYDD